MRRYLLWTHNQLINVFHLRRSMYDESMQNWSVLNRKKRIEQTLNWQQQRDKRKNFDVENGVKVRDILKSPGAYVNALMIFCRITHAWNYSPLPSTLEDLNQWTYLLGQWFPTGVPGPLGVRNNIFGGPKCYAIFEGESLYVIVGYTFFQNNQDLWKLASAITQKNII